MTSSSNIPSKSKISEVLGRRRPLSLPMIRALRSGLNIPAEVLVQAPRLSRKEKVTTGRYGKAGEPRSKSLRRTASRLR